ncbi:g335 [Coccomyxa elongata]
MCESQTPATPQAATHQGEPTDAIVFVVITMVVGVFTLHLLSFTKIPYTALLLVWGVIFGVGNQSFSQNWKLVGEGTRLWESIDPTLLLTAFLPILLFAGAFALEWHTVRRLMWSSLLLAGPGVLVGTALTAVLVKYTFPYDWSWVESLLFGAMFSATDPVAVVAVLKEAGLSKRLRTLVDCEALLNDGTAFTLFLLLKGFTEGQELTAADTVREFVQLAVGGPLAGLAFGIATTFWLRFMYNTPMAEITLTIVSAYGTYIVADELMHVSAVLAVVILGIYMSAKGVMAISRKVEHPLHIIWEELEFLANTLIFVLSGVIITGKIWESSTTKADYIQPADYGYAVLLWVYLVVIRGLLFVIFWPILKRSGYGLTVKQAAVLSWSGLRGAVGLSLSLFVLLDQKIADERYRTLSFFFMGIAAFLTTLVQGSTMAPLLQFMGLVKPPAVKRDFLKRLLHEVEEHGEKKLDYAGFDRLLGDPDYHLLRQLTTLDVGHMLKRYVSKLHLRHQNQDHVEAKLHALALRMNRNGLLAEKRSRLLLAIRQTYNDFFHDYFISSDQVFKLRECADKALDNVEKPLCDWAALKSSTRVSPWIKYIQRWAHLPLLGEFIQVTFFRKLEDIAVLALAFCHAHEITLKDLATYGVLQDDLDANRGSAAYLGLDAGLEELVLAMQKNVMNQVVLESRSECEKAQRLIALIKRSYPEVLTSIKTKQLAQEILLHKAEHIGDVAKTGLVEDQEVESMNDLVEQKLKKLHYFPPQFHIQAPHTMLAAHPLLAGVPENRFRKEVLSQASLKVYNKGELLDSGQTQQLFVLLRGCVCLHYPDSKTYLAEPGAVMCAWPVLPSKDQFTKLVATTIVQTYSIPFMAFKELMRRYDGVNSSAWQSCAAALALISRDSSFKDFSFNELQTLFRLSKLVSVRSVDYLRVAGSAFLVTGTVHYTGLDRSLSKVYEGACMLPATPALYWCTTDVKVLELPPTFDLSLKQMTTASLTARLASKQPQLLPLWFGGSSAFNNGIQRPSMGGAHLAQRAAALLSDDGAFNFLSRRSAPAELNHEAEEADDVQSNSSNTSTDDQDSSPLDTAPSTASKKHVSLAHALSQGLPSFEDGSADTSLHGPMSPRSRWSNSHTLTGASGPQLLREWTEQLADARSAQGRHRGLRPLGGSPSAAHTAQSADLDITPREDHKGLESLESDGQTSPMSRGASITADGGSTPSPQLPRGAKSRSPAVTPRAPRPPVPGGAPWRAGLSAHGVGTNTVSGLTGNALLKEWKAMQKSAAAGAAYWDSQPGQHHPRSFTAVASPFSALSRAQSESRDGDSASSSVTSTALRRVPALQLVSQGGSAPASAEGGKDATGSERAANAVAGLSAEQKVVPSGRLSRPSLTALFADLPLLPSRSQKEAPSSATTPPVRKEHSPPRLPQMPSGPPSGAESAALSGHRSVNDEAEAQNGEVVKIVVENP